VTTITATLAARVASLIGRLCAAGRLNACCSSVSRAAVLSG
jgi:hypothetical protein